MNESDSEIFVKKTMEMAKEEFDKQFVDMITSLVSSAINSGLKKSINNGLILPMNDVPAKP